jgi:hypothetical protein
MLSICIISPKVVFGMLEIILPPNPSLPLLIVICVYTCQHM